jgi:hypothetical protein
MFLNPTGIGARTVYGYFRREIDLVKELWPRVRKHFVTIFPSTEEEILPELPILGDATSA